MNITAENLKFVSLLLDKNVWIWIMYNHNCPIIYFFQVYSIRPFSLTRHWVQGKEHVC